MRWNVCTRFYSCGQRRDWFSLNLRATRLPTETEMGDNRLRQRYVRTLRHDVVPARSPSTTQLNAKSLQSPGQFPVRDVRICGSTSIRHKNWQVMM